MPNRISLSFPAFLFAAAVCSAADLTGTAVDAAGAAIPGARVTAATGALTRETTTRADGVFTFTGLPDGKFEINVSAPSFQPAHASVTLPAANPLRIVLDVASVRTEVTVSAGGDYNVAVASTATKTDLPIRDIPQSIQVISRQVIDDQAAFNMADIVRNVSGVTVPNSSGGRMEDFVIRGFTTGAQFKDGFRNDSNSNRAAMETANIERVEVLKGPSSAMFGRLDPSGVVNITTKRPLAGHYAMAQINGGSFGFIRPHIDLGGPLSRGGKLTYRLNVAGERADTFRVPIWRDRWFVAPSVTWNITDRDILRFDAEYLGGSSVVDRGLFAVGNRPLNLPRSTYLGDPAIPYKYQQGKAGFSYDRIFSPRWTLRSYQRSSLAKADYDSRQPRLLLPDGRTMSMSLTFSDQFLQAHYWVNDLIGKFSTGSIEHTLLIGLDLNRESFESYSVTGANQTLDIYQPTYRFPPYTLNLNGDSMNTNRFAGAYIQDQIRLTRRWKVLVGGRYDIAQLRNENFLRNTRTNYRNTAFVPRAGIVYQPVDPVSLYFNFGKSFNPQSGVSFDGSPFEPERGEQFEAGVKLDLLNGRLTATSSVFQVTKANVLTSDPFNAGFSIQVGEQRVRGFEVDFTGQIARGWNAVFTYAHTEPLITRDNVYKPGNYILSAPKNTGSLWTTYEFDRGALRGLGVGAGVFAAGSRWGDLENSFIVPGYARVDGAVFYKVYRQDRLRYRLSFNLNNAGDRYYFEGVRGRYGVVPGSPRNLIAGLQMFLK